MNTRRPAEPGSATRPPHPKARTHAHPAGRHDQPEALDRAALYARRQARRRQRRGLGSMATAIIIVVLCLVVIVVAVQRLNAPPDLRRVTDALHDEHLGLARASALTGDQAAEIRAAIARAHPTAVGAAQASGSVEAAAPAYRNAMAQALQADGTLDRVYRSVGIVYDLVPGIRFGGLPTVTAAPAAPAASAPAPREAAPAALPPAVPPARPLPPPAAVPIAPPPPNPPASATQPRSLVDEARSRSM